MRPKDENETKYLPFWSHFFDKEAYGTAETGKAELTEILGTNAHGFETVKPMALIKKLIFHVKEKFAIGSEPAEIVLDFFAGSGTTGHAVLDLNKQDNGNRRFILVQLPEPCDRESAAFKAGYKTIADITKERVRRVIKKMNKEDEGKLGLDGKKQDRGFKVFKLSESNFKTWESANPQGDPAKLTKQMELHINHVRENRTQDDILFEILLKSGFPLTTPIEKLPSAGKTIHSAAGGGLLICLERQMTLELIRAMADKKPERVVCLDEGFAGNDQLKANAVQTFKDRNVVFRTV
jgi:adenine-specific DNA-methyltransferase